MKFSVLIASLVSIASAGVIVPRQADQAANIGYATLNGGTTGGSGGPSVTVSSLSDLQNAVKSDDKKIVYVQGNISGSGKVNIGANTSLLGKSGASITGISLNIKKKNNVIIRGLKISKVVADNGDAIGIQYAKNVWVDRVELWSDMSHDKDYYDGLLDITHGCDYITVSHVYFHDHWKASLVGHSDNNASEDRGHLTITYAFNKWSNINSRTPSFRFGTGHVFNNYFVNVNDGINTRQGAQVLVENNVFSNVKKPLYSTDSGYATARGNDFGGASNAALSGSISSVPYSYSLQSASSVVSYVNSNAGATISF